MFDTEMYDFCVKLYPIMRSLTGEGNRKTLKIIKEILPDLNMYEVPSGYQAFDWVVPKEWNIKEAYLDDEYGNRVVDLKDHNLHVLSYSTPVDKVLTLQELEEHLYSLADQENVIPYVTSYYKERWGFCMRHRDRLKLKDCKYHAVINSSLEDGGLSYADLLIKGESEEEIMFSTYICHPQMANNELSGPAVQTYLAKKISEMPNRRYSYRFVYIPETLGSIVYLSKNIDKLKKNVKAGFVLTCIGDEAAFTYIPSRNGGTLADRVILSVLNNNEDYGKGKFNKRTYLDRGSDERQYCAPGVDLPFCSVTRGKYSEYKEYHTSLDNLDFISGKALGKSFDFYWDVVNLLENNYKYMCNILCEPQLGKRGLYPTISAKGSATGVRDMMNVIAYCDGTKDLIEISDITSIETNILIEIVRKLQEHNIVSL